MSSKLNIEKAWEILFEKHDIISHVKKHGYYKISSGEINKVKEARLMAKFDQSSQLPYIFRSNCLSILPISRGDYIIGSFKTHAEVIYSDVKPIAVDIPDLQTIDYTNLYSEASSLLFAFNSGIIQDLMGSSKVNFTVNGRMSSGSFDFSIGDIIEPSKPYQIAVQNAQIEIDAGYESPECFCICEAKNMAVPEILIRQLYYPYRLWRSKISKAIIPLFMVYSNDIFHAFIYHFEDDLYYNSLKLIQHKAYTFAGNDLKLSDIIVLWKNIKVISEPDVTFPQADSFARVIDLLSLLYNGELTRDEVTIYYEFDPRQTNYYIAACEYLGLIERAYNENKERIYKLSPEAYHIMSLKYKDKYLALIKKIIERPVFYHVFDLVIKYGKLPDKKEICKIMSEANLSINQVTIERRSSTVRGWIEWILNLV